MLTISERKVAGFTPRWAPFPGFSLLFDTSASSRRRIGELERIDCDVVGDPELGFYRRVFEGFERFDPDLLLRTYLFCPLPSASYHVTAFDVANLADVSRCRSEWLDPLRALLEEVPTQTWALDNPILAPAAGSALAEENWDLRLKYDKLSMFGRGGISLHLKAADVESEAILARFTTERSALSAFYRQRFGMGAGPRFTPHVSIGYFANPEGAELASAHMPRWDAELRASVGDEVLTFQTASLYSFTSMEHFARRAR